MSVLQLIGIAGFVTYIGSFAALQFKRLDGNGPAYAFLNVIAASLVLVSLTEAFNLASALIQVSWIIIGLVGLTWRLGLAWKQARARAFRSELRPTK